MNILVCGDENEVLTSWLRDNGELVYRTSDKITLDLITKRKVDFLVSYNYRHIIKKDVLDFLPKRAINLHISYLPYNRGAYPNVFSHIDGTPSGISIHCIDEGIDTGDLIVRTMIKFNGNETLRESYDILQHEIVKLFKSNWHKIRSGMFVGIKQRIDVGTYHTVADFEKLNLPHGFDTKIISLWEQYDNLGYRFH